MTGSKTALLALILGAFTCLISPISRAAEEGGVDKMFKYYHVYITNDLPMDTPNLLMHCWSSEDDVGIKSLAPKGAYSFQFELTFLKRTRFECEGGWGSHYARFTGFKAYRDETRCSKNYYCLWSVRSDGFYFSNNNSTWGLEYKWSFAMSV